MRKTVSLLLAAVMVLSVGGAALADSIKGSKHDLSSTGHVDVQTQESQVCVFCHTPHNASTIGPLWNRNSAPAGTTYTLYQSESLDGTPQQPVPGSRNVATQASGSDLCLSCHDGTVALTSVIKPAFSDTGRNAPSPKVPPAAAMNESGVLLSTRSAFLGVNLADDHPVAFNYAQAYANEAARLGAAALAPADTGQNWVLGTLANAPNGADMKLPLFNGNMECDTCHNVHDPGADHPGVMYPFLRADMTASKLCFSCHIK